MMSISELVEDELTESEKTGYYATHHAPRGHGGSNYVTRSKPGNKGQYPSYFQNVRNAMVKGGRTMAQASAMTWGALRRWARGGGNVSAEVKAAAIKALAELEAMGAASKARTAAHLAEADVVRTPGDVRDRVLIDAFGRLYV